MKQFLLRILDRVRHWIAGDAARAIPADHPQRTTWNYTEVGARTEIEA